jgi:hypothetical protein
MKKYRVLKFLAKKAHQKDIDKFIEYLGDNKAAINFFLKSIAN